ncbi:MAG: amidohydrolase [Saprospiraceae bacterium]|nr:amidohydrolase [Lewinella sp.]
MRYLLQPIWVLFLLLPLGLLAQQYSEDQLSSLKEKSFDQIESGFKGYGEMAQEIWNYAEVGYQEYKSSELLQHKLKEAGFTVEAGVAEIPTAFVATYGSGKPVIGILAEFDALPGLSQQATPEPLKDESRTSGHGCGHNLFGVGSVAAAIAVKEQLTAGTFKGTVKVFGTPAEEGGSGKVYMVRAGLFDDVDVVLHWHPGNSNSASARSSLANTTAKFRFHGISAHAAASPWDGRSALDGVEAMDDMVNMMREHVPQETRIHYIITAGGDAPNVVPNFAEVYYYVRHPDMAQVKSIFKRLVKVAEGAAIGTETEMDYEIMSGVYNLLPVEALGQLMYANLQTVGGVTYDEKEMEFAKTLQATFTNQDKVPDIKSAESIRPFEVIRSASGGGSTDVGDVSWVVPTVGLGTATYVPGTPAHSWQAVACAGGTIGKKGMLVAAKTLAATAMDLYNDGELIKKAREEWLQYRGEDFKYEPLLGDRKPALDYRN